MIQAEDYPYPVQKIKLSAGPELAYIEVGEGPHTLLFVHGFASHLPVWAHNLEVLKKYYRCLALDLPGHGLSEIKDYPYTISFYAEVVQSFIEDKKLGPMTLIGHSMGGQISSRLAIDHAQSLQQLVLVAPAGFETFTMTEKALMRQFTTSSILSGSQYWKWALNLKNYFYELNEKEYEKLNEFNRNFYSIRSNPLLPKILSRSVNGMIDEPIFEDLEKIACPTLVFFGKQDLLIPNRFLHQLSTQDLAERGVRRIPQGQLKMYEKSGHFLQYEHPARFNMDLYKFLNPLIFQ
ncbi:MAG: alpha/beta hydrolase [Bacteroidota bacterium]